MPQIKPTSVEDLLKFIKDHRSDIEDGTYDFDIDRNWVPKLSEDTLRFLIGHCPATHYVLASGALPAWASEILARNTVTGVRQAVAQNHNTPTWLLEILAKDISDDVREDIARNPNTTPEVLSSLSKDKQPSVRCFTAAHSNTSVSALEILAKDSGTCNGSHLGGFGSHVVRMSVALNPNTPQKTLEILGRDIDHQVIDAVTRNPNSPHELVDNLTADWEPNYRSYDPSSYVGKIMAKKRQQEALMPCLIIFGIIGGIVSIASGNVLGLLIGVAIGYLWSFLAYIRK